MNHRNTALAAAVALVAASGGGTAAGQPAIALIGERTLLVIDTGTAQSMGGFDLPGTGRLLGIDWRASDQQLYALSAGGELLRIDFETQTAVTVATTDIPLPAEGPVAMDFDQVLDQLRLTSGLTSRRIDPDTGAVAIEGELRFAPGAGLRGKMPAIVASACLNEVGDAAAPAEYHIDSGLVALLRQTGPDDGVLAPVGALGLAAAESYAFDIGAGPDGSNTAWLVAHDMLHTVSLEDGSVTASWPLPAQAGGIRDVAILSHM